MYKSDYNLFNLTVVKKSGSDPLPIFINNEYVGYCWRPVPNLRHFSFLIVKEGPYLAHCVEWCVNQWPQYGVVWEEYDTRH